MKKKTILYIFIGLLITGGAAFYFLRSGTPEIKFNTTVVEKGDIQVAVTATGKINPVMSVQVGTQVSGTVSKIYVDFNSEVKKGQVIAEIDKTYLLESLQDAKATMERAQIQMEQAKREYVRLKQLFEEKVVSKSEFEVAESNYRTAVTNYNSSRSQLNRAEINLTYATIKAPIDGIVVLRSVDVGQTVAASFNTPTLFTIANDLTKMQVEASVDEADIGNIKKAQNVNFTVDAYPGETFSGSVKQIRLQPTVTQNVVTYSVIIEVNNPDMKLLPGMTANISVVIEKHENVLKVPNSALRFTPDPEQLKDFMEQVPDSIKQKFKENQGKRKKPTQNTKKGSGKGSKERLWIKQGNQIIPVRVETGLSDGTYTEVKGKIKENDEVIINIIKEEKENSQQQNPFTPQRPRGRKM